jgi:predicted transcriptional regulator
MTRIGLEIPGHLAGAIQRIAAARGITEDAVVAEALAPFADHEAEMERRIEEGRAGIAAGRFVEHDEVAARLRSWGTEGELPPPRCD